MFLYIYDALFMGIVLTCILGISLTLQYFLPKVRYCVLFCYVPLVFIIPFFIEHFIPLGRPTWIFIPMLLVSAYMIRRRGYSLLSESVLWYFMIGFLFSLIFRFQNPNLECNIEKTADHAFLIDCSHGELLPPEDCWVKGAHLDMYYYFQYYVAAWMSRGLMVSTGACCNIGLCLVIGFGTAAVGSAVRFLALAPGELLVEKLIGTGWWAVVSREFWKAWDEGVYGTARLLLVMMYRFPGVAWRLLARAWAAPSTAGFLAVMFCIAGANGAVIFVPFMVTHYSYWDPLMFNGFFDNPTIEHRNDVLPFGLWFMNTFGFSPTFTPFEYYAHTIVLGDFHPSLSSLYLLGAFLLAICVAEREPHRSPTDRACFTLGVLLTASCIILNSWILPLNGLLFLSWVICRQLNKKRDSLKEIIGTSLGAGLLIFPFLSHFVAGEQNYRLTLDWGYVDIPLINWLMEFYPAVLMLGLGMILVFRGLARLGILLMIVLFAAYQYSGLATRLGDYYWIPDVLPLFVFALICCVAKMHGGLARYFVIAGVFFLLFTRYIHVDDYMGAEYNTSLKWWPWAYSFVMILGIGVLWRSWVYRVGMLLPALIVIVPYLYIITPMTIWNERIGFGKLDGSYFVRRDVVYNAMLDYLVTLPKGIMVEGVGNDDPQGPPMVQLFTQHYSLGGWIQHELVWRTVDRRDLERLAMERMDLYQAKLTDPRDWLLSHDVDYMVWILPDDLRDDNKGLTYWAKINDQIKSSYRFVDFSDPHLLPQDRRPVGVWVRRDYPTPLATELHPVMTTSVPSTP